MLFAFFDSMLSWVPGPVCIIIVIWLTSGEATYIHIMTFSDELHRLQGHQLSAEATRWKAVFQSIWHQTVYLLWLRYYVGKSRIFNTIPMKTNSNDYTVISVIIEVYVLPIPPILRSLLLHATQRFVTTCLSIKESIIHLPCWLNNHFLARWFIESTTSLN